MYFLVYVVPATGGTGFGVFCVIMIALAMLVGAAQYGITWLLAPVATIMALVENSALWWILPTVLVIVAGINWASAKAKDDTWFPLLTAGILVVVLTIVIIVALVVDLINGYDMHWYDWFTVILGPIIGVPFVSLFFYSTLNTCIALSSVTTLPCGYKPCVGALCSLFGMIGAALFLQGLIEGVVSWGGESTFYEMVSAHLEEGALKFLTFDLVSNEKTPEIIRRLEGIVDAIAMVPAWLRCFLGLALAIGCGIGEYKCSDGDALF